MEQPPKREKEPSLEEKAKALYRAQAEIMVAEAKTHSKILLTEEQEEQWKDTYISQHMNSWHISQTVPESQFKWRKKSMAKEIKEEEERRKRTGRMEDDK